MRLYCKAILGALLCAASLHTLAAPAQAFPPAGVSGIDLSTVLTLDDRARRFAVEADPGSAEREPLKQIRTIVLDPGHGGENEGALGVVEIQEKFLTLELAYRLRDKLQQKYPDARVLLTRYWDRDLSLSERVHYANLQEADLFISLHYNAAVHNRAIGYETYFLAADEATPGAQEKKGEPIATATPVVTGLAAEDMEQKEGTYNDALLTLKRDLERERQNRESGVFAELVQANLAERLESIDRGVKQADFGVLRGALMPAVVVEAGFLTHPEEGVAVTAADHRERTASALLGAIEAFDEKLEERAQK